jgi:hypothetical protein
MNISATATPDCAGTVRPAAFPLRVTPILFGLVLLAASGLKTYQLTRSPPQSGQSWLDAPVVVVAPSISELLLAAFLLSGLWPATLRRIAIRVFALFAAFALYEAIIGRKNCGCFGAVRVSPWITAAFDLCAVAAGVATAAVWGIRRPVVVTGDLAAANGVDPFGAPDSLVVLEPSGWANKPFALASHIDGGAQLADGRWIVLLVHHDCDHCIAAVPRYEALAQAHPEIKLAIVEMPPYAGAGEELPITPVLTLTGRLDTTRDWFATTPVVVLLKDGIVQQAAEGDAAATPDPAWGEVKGKATVFRVKS